ncbi:hypothetical protein GCM10009660_29530 [Catellatospora bangladeshensis]
MQVGADYVRDVIHACNERGFAALDPEWSGGRPKVIGEAVRQRICLIARTSPASWGITAFSTWPLSTLRDHLLDRGTVATISRETLRRILHAGGVSRQATTTRKTSTDPDLLTKMHRILDLYDHPPEAGRVICNDEFGPLDLQPRKGKAWQPTGSPRRLRATHNRHHGVMHMLAALDLTTGKIHYRIHRRKRHRELPELLTSPRTRWPGQRLHLVMDNFSPHRHPDVHARAAVNDVELVFLPTYSSWLNWIGAEFTALCYFILNGTDTTATPSRTPPSPPTSAGATPEPDPRPASPPTHPSAPGPVPDQGCVMQN